MKKLKKLLLSLACFALGAALTLVGTLAYLQDETDTAYNVMTSGNVKIEQLELERKAGSLVDFNVGKPADPAVYNDANVSKDVTIDWSNLGYNGSSNLYADSIGNVVDHFVFVRNTGKNAAYLRTVIAIECPNGFNADNIHVNKNESTEIVWTNYTTTIDGVQYMLLVATYAEALAGGATSAPSLLQVYLDPTVVNEDTELFGDTWDVLVISQAVQTTGFQAPDGVLPADHALDTAFGDVNALNTPWTDKEVKIPAVANEAAELRALLDTSKEIVVYGNMNAAGTVDVPSWTNAPAEFIFDATVVNKISGGNFVLDEASRYGIVARISDGESLAISDMSITANSQWPVYLANWGGNLVVSDVTIEAEAGAGIYPYGTDGTTVLNNVKVNQNRLDPAYSSTTPWAATAVAASDGHNLIINSGTYIGSTWAVYGYNSGSTITINGGTFKAPTVIQLDGVWSGTNKSVATVNGGNFDGAIKLDWGTNAPELYINGGNFTNFSATVYGAAKLVITGGTFDADPSAYVAAGHVVYENDGIYTVLPINNEETFRYAMSKLDNIKLMGNISLDADETLTVVNGATKTIDLNGYTLSSVAEGTGNRELFLVKGNLTVKNGKVTIATTVNQGWNAMSTVFDVTAGGVLNIEDATVANVGGTDMAFGVHLNNWGEVTLNVENSVIDSPYCAIRVYNSGFDDNNVTINNSKIHTTGNRAIWVHNYIGDLDKTKHPDTAVDARLKFDIYGNGNEIVADNATTMGPIRYGFSNPVYFFADGTPAMTAESLQAAIDNATDGAVIKLTNDVSGTVVITQPDNADFNIVIDGQGFKFDGTIKIKGMSQFDGADNDSIVIKNINFTTSTKDTDFIWSSNTANGTYWRYAHNVTIENCTFTATGDAKYSVVGVRFQQAYNIKVVNCVATGVHSLLQAESCETTVEVNGCKVVDGKGGVSLNNTMNAIVKNCEFESVVDGGYGIRHKGQINGYGLTVENCKVSAFIPVLVRNMTATTYTATFSGNNKLTATNDFGYQVVFSGGDWDNDASAPAVPTGNYTVTGADNFTVFGK